jgi:IS1 family transposase
MLTLYLTLRIMGVIEIPMNTLSLEKRTQILGMMVEGMSIRAISRLTGASKNTLVKLLADAGEIFAAYHDEHVRNLPCKRLQLDEIWSFVGCKEKNVTPEKKAEGQGDIWTWTAICADTKLIASWFIGDRTAETGTMFTCDLRNRLAGRVQITTDGHKAYLQAMDAAFGEDVDYAMLVKIYGNTSEGQKRYSPAQIKGTSKTCCTGNPDIKQVSTSYAERQNLSMRMGMRRFTRLTNGFSKNVENHAHALAIYFMHYNFVRIHQTLRCSPAMAAGVTTTLWSLEDMAKMLDKPAPAKRGPYKKKVD